MVWRLSANFPVGAIPHCARPYPSLPPSDTCMYAREKVRLPEIACKFGAAAD
jgi:hypothetical protein